MNLPEILKSNGIKFDICKPIGKVKRSNTVRNFLRKMDKWEAQARRKSNTKYSGVMI